MYAVVFLTGFLSDSIAVGTISSNVVPSVPLSFHDLFAFLSLLNSFHNDYRVGASKTEGI